MKSQTINKVNDLLMDKLGLDETPKMNDKLIDDLGADSLDAVEIIMDCESEFGIKIPDEEAEYIVTVEDIVNTVESKLEN